MRNHGTELGNKSQKCAGSYRLEGHCARRKGGMWYPFGSRKETKVISDTLSFND